MIFDLPTEQARDLGREWARVSAISASQGHQPVLWSFAPHFVGNPYQEILYSSFAPHGFAVRGGRTYQEAADALAIDLPFAKVLHLHWLNVVLSKAESREVAETRIKEFAVLLDRMRARGVRLVWTMHNVLPHESKFAELEIELRKVVIERAEMVHIMSPDSVSLSEGLFSIPSEKIVRVEHPGYTGFYPMWQSKEAARAQLGISPFERTFLVLGAIKPYKGLLELAHEFDLLTREFPRKYSLLIAGEPSRHSETDALLDLAATHPSIHVLPERMSADRVGMLYSTADAALIPYRASLNSGALVLALSMGKPVIARQSAGSTHLLSSGAGGIYADATQLRAALTDDQWLEPATNAAELMAQRLDPRRVTSHFARVARAFVDDGVSAARAVAEEFDV